ncbi:MAG: PD-(D/E)XK nuclease family protein [Nitrospiraceae bacterium]|nr:PD-(D/E)XK nuclease family protein [Nitrospiraceae bacterium]
MIPISNSKLSAFECPFYFREKYILRTPYEKNSYLEEGTFLHLVAQVYTDQLVKNKLGQDAELLEMVFSGLWKAQTALPESFYNSLYGVVKGFGERFKIDPDKIWKTEVGIAFNQNFSAVEFPNLHSYEDEDRWCSENGIFVHQRIDRVDMVTDSIWKATDYKSARTVTSQSELERKGQGKQYAWAIMEKNPFIQKVIFVWDFIRYENAKVEIEYDRGSVVDVPKMLKTFWEKVNSLNAEDPADWPAHQGTTCSLCNYPCPLNDSSLAIPRVIQDEEVAFRLAQKAQCLKRDTKTIEDRLKMFLKEREPLDIGLGSYGTNTTMSLGVGVKELVQFCLDNGLDLNKYLSADKEKALKAVENLNDDLKENFNMLRLACGGGKISQRFGFKKAAKVKATEEEIYGTPEKDEVSE